MQVSLGLQQLPFDSSESKSGRHLTRLRTVAPISRGKQGTGDRDRALIMESGPNPTLAADRQVACDAA